MVISAYLFKIHKIKIHHLPFNKRMNLHLYNFASPLLNDAFCQVRIYIFSQLFWRRDFYQIYFIYKYSYYINIEGRGFSFEKRKFYSFKDTLCQM